MRICYSLRNNFRDKRRVDERYEEQFKSGMLDATKMEVTKNLKQKIWVHLRTTNKDGHLITFSNVFIWDKNLQTFDKCGYG